MIFSITTLSITTLSITTLSIMALSIMTLSIMIYSSIMTLSKKVLFVTLSLNDIQQIRRPA